MNLSPDHIERHKTLNNYIKAKFKLIKNQSFKDFSFLKKNDNLILRQLKKYKIKSKIIKVDKKKIKRFLKKVDNSYFKTETNKENLSFVLEIIKKFKIKRDLLNKTIKNFKGLKYRQQIIFKKKNLTVINDSKSTSFSSSIDLLKIDNNIYWLLGGIHKKGDKFNLPKKYFKNIKAFIYSKNKSFFIKKLKGKIKYDNSNNLKDAIRKVFKAFKKHKLKKQTILFSPCAASFDNFKNFEERGKYFNFLVKRYKLKNAR